MYYIVNPMNRIFDDKYTDSGLRIDKKPFWYVLETASGRVSQMSSEAILALPDEWVAFDRPEFNTLVDMCYEPQDITIGGNIVKPATFNTFIIGGKTWELWEHMGVIYVNDLILAESPYLTTATRLSYLFVDGDYVLVRVLVRAGGRRNWLSLIFRFNGEFEGVSILSGEGLKLRWFGDSVYIARMLISGVQFKY